MWEFIKSSTNKNNYLHGHAKEICFMGRSNVGKSSLINALAKTKIANTSNRPGCTRLINFFKENNKFFVDLPGYGYAKISKKNQDKMFSMIEEYINNRKIIARVFLLIDSKIGITKNDEIVLDFLNNNNLPFFIVITKIDKVNQSQLYKTKRSIELWTNNFIEVSALKRKNIIKLEKIINKCF